MSTVVGRLRFSTMAELLVSVRCAAEAEAALAGGAALIDVKEPAHGALGRAADDEVASVLRIVAGRRPVSAALGEVAESPAPFPERGLSYAKWGLSGCGQQRDCFQPLIRAAGWLHRADPRCRLVAVAYADWQRANSPRPVQVSAWACAWPGAVLLVDTWCKDGTTLLDWLSLAELEGLRAGCQTAGVRLALAGSLGPRQIASLRSVDPDWFAVRGAVCQAGNRQQPVATDAVRRLVELLRAPIRAAKRGD